VSHPEHVGDIPEFLQVRARKLGLIIRKHDERFLVYRANGDLVVTVAHADQLNEELNCYEGRPFRVLKECGPFRLVEIEVPQDSIVGPGLYRDDEMNKPQGPIASVTPLPRKGEKEHGQ
jgi:hypothetical protein